VKKDHSVPSGLFLSVVSHILVTIWWLKMIDWVTAIIPCYHDEMIFGGFFTSVSLDGEID
jgi:hypothetical protein